MNQILFVGAKEKGDIKKIVKFFCILILAFGLILTAEGVYGVLSSNNSTETGDKNTLPVADITKTGDFVRIIASHDKAIDKVLYSWNGGAQIQLNGNGRTYIEEVVELPQGENELKVVIKDINGIEASYTKQFTIGAEQDKTKPQIRVEDEPGFVALKITVTENIALKSVKYKWNDEQFVEVSILGEESKKLEKTIELLIGDNVLTVVAVDTAGNEAVLEKPVKTSSRPRIELTQSGSVLVIKATDEKEMLRITYDLNGERTTIKTDYVTKEIEYAENLKPGVNVIVVTAYNIDGVISTYENTYTVNQ